MIAEKLYPAAGLLNQNLLMMWASKVVPYFENMHWSFGVVGGIEPVPNHTLP
jgi:hypothetical protein